MRTSFWIYVGLFLAIPTLIQMQTIHKNVSYGSDPQQIMDIYLPANQVSKVIVLIHGGGWIRGSKESMSSFVDLFRSQFSSYCIINIDYRLATATSPAIPKQIIDVGSSIKFIRSQLKSDDLTFSLVGTSAGAHLAMLYSYGYDRDKVVKVVVNAVGPADFTDWAYVGKPSPLKQFYPYLLGPPTYWHNPGLYWIISPVAWINQTSPKTILFYGDEDPLIPVSQGSLLSKRLAQAGVTNELNLYPGGHINNWTKPYLMDMFGKTFLFLTLHF